MSTKRNKSQNEQYIGFGKSNSGNEVFITYLEQAIDFHGGSITSLLEAATNKYKDVIKALQLSVPSKNTMGHLRTGHERYTNRPPQLKVIKFIVAMQKPDIDEQELTLEAKRIFETWLEPQAKFDDVIKFIIKKKGITNSHISNKNFKGQDLTSFSFSGSELKALDFSECQLARSEFRDTQLVECRLLKAILTGCSFERTLIKNSVLATGSFSATSARQTNFHDVRGGKSKWNRAYFLQSDWVKCKFDDADFARAHFSTADIFGSTFNNAIMRYACFYRSTVRESSFVSCAAYGIIFEDTNFFKTNWNDANLRQSRFFRATFMQCSLKNVCLDSSWIDAETSFSECLFNQTSFTRTYMEGKDEKDAYITFHNCEMNQTVWRFCELEYVYITGKTVLEQSGIHHSRLNGVEFKEECSICEMGISKTSLKHCKFEGVNAEAFKLTNHCEVEDSNFTQVILDRGKFSNSSFRNVKFNNCSLKGLLIENCRFTKCQFENVDFSTVLLEKGNLFVDCHFNDVPESDNLKHILKDLSPN